MQEHFFSEYYIGKFQDVFWNNAIIIHSHSHNYLPFIQTLIIKSSVALGILLAAILYFYNKNIASTLSKNFKTLYLISLNKWYGRFSSF